MDDKKLLFVFQDANFCPKTLLVPAAEFNSVRPNDLDLLTKHAVREGEVLVLVQNYLWTNDYGKMDSHEWSHVAARIKSVALYEPDEMSYRAPKDGDQSWVAKSQILDTYLFDPRQVIAQAFSAYQKELSHAFLILEGENGVVRESPPVKDVQEMYRIYYSGKEQKSGD